MSRLNKKLPLLIVLLVASTIALSDEIATLQLNNRPAVEVIPIIEPMLSPGDVITGHGFKIFLRSSRETLAQVESMIEAIDAAQKVLLISVLQGNASQFKSHDLGGKVSIRQDGVNASFSANASQQQSQSRPVHKIRVTEGREGYIQTGKQIALFSGNNSSSSGHGGFKKISSGFYVLPRVQGDNVFMHISPFKSSQGNIGGGSINTQQARTTIQGRLGEWLLVGGVNEQVSQSQSSLSGYSSSRGNSDSSIWIKADIVR